MRVTLKMAMYYCFNPRSPLLVNESLLFDYAGLTHLFQSTFTIASERIAYFCSAHRPPTRFNPRSPLLVNESNAHVYKALAAKFQSTFTIASERILRAVLTVLSSSRSVSIHVHHC